jgi:rod shape-determining protein MreC
MLNFASRKNGGIVWRGCLACFLAGSFIIADFYQVQPVILIKSSLDNLIAPAKIFANKIIELPKLILGLIEIKRENKRLRTEIDELRVQAMGTTNVKQELDELRQSLNLKCSMPKFQSIERVLGSDKSFFESFLLISAKERETKPQSVVISNEGLVGIVYEVHQNKIAKVMMLIDNKLCIPIISKSGERMIIAGDGIGGLESVVICDTHVADRMKNFKIGDVLYTSGEGGVFPRNIPVAKIHKIDTVKGKIHALPITDFKMLNFVMILDPILVNSNQSTTTSP